MRNSSEVKIIIRQLQPVNVAQTMTSISQIIQSNVAACNRDRIDEQLQTETRYHEDLTLVARVNIQQSQEVVEKIVAQIDRRLAQTEHLVKIVDVQARRENQRNRRRNSRKS